MIGDEELLAACRSAGPPGSASHREACRLYRAAAAEWRERHRVALEGRCALAAGDVLCGSARGYRRCRRRGVRACPRCRKAWSAYCRARARARRAAKAAAAARLERQEAELRVLLRSPIMAAHRAGTLVLGAAA